MHLVLNVGYKGERRAVGSQGDLARIADDGAGAMVVILDHAEHGDAQSRRRYHRQHGADLSLAAVEQDEIGQSAEAGSYALLLRLFVFIQAAGEHLRHGAVVVLSGERLDLELAVGAFQRPGVLEHDHARDVIRAGEVGDIVALDVFGELFQTEQVFQLIQHTQLSTGHALELAEGLKRVFAAHIDEVFLRTALGNIQINALALSLTEPALGVLAILDLAVERDVRGNLLAQRVIAQDELGTEIDLVVHVVDDEILGIVQARFVEAQNGGGALVLLPCYGDHVKLVQMDIDDLLLVAHLLHRGDLVAIMRGALKVQRLCRGSHPLL